MITGLRGLAQSFVRGAVVLGRAVEATYSALTDLGLGYVRSRFDMDFAAYDAQPFLMEQIGQRPSEQLISGGLHQKTDIGLKANFKYDVQKEVIDPTGKVTTITRSVASDYRMSPDEIGEEVEAWGVGTDPPDVRPLTDWKMSGSWALEREIGQ